MYKALCFFDVLIYLLLNFLQMRVRKCYNTIEMKSRDNDFREG